MSNTSFIAATLGLAAAIGGPYSTLDYTNIPKPKKVRGIVVGCSICGATQCTLHRTADGMICDECKNHKND